MRRGRKPKPTALKRAAGNPGKRKLNEHEPRPRRGCLAPPRWLSPAARTEWRRLAPELTRLGLLTAADRAAFAGYCQAWSRYLEAEEAARKQLPVLIVGKNNYPIQNPLLIIAHKALSQVIQIAAEFGLTPASRSRVSAESEEEAAGDEILDPAPPAGAALTVIRGGKR